MKLGRFWNAGSRAPRDKQVTQLSREAVKHRSAHAMIKTASLFGAIND
jgi:hypothetical protein